MIHPDSALVWINQRVGRGVRATAAIPRGTLLWVRDGADRVLAPRELAALDPEARRLAEHLGYRDHLGRTIVCADAGAYVNHSCRPAMRGVGPDAMIAIRDLAAGDELTCDYAECNLDEPLRCACGEPECRRVIGDRDLERLGASWQREVEAAVAAARGQPQPLLAAAVDRDRLAAVLEGRMRCPPLVEIQLSRASGRTEACEADRAWARRRAR